MYTSIYGRKRGIVAQSHCCASALLLSLPILDRRVKIYILCTAANTNHHCDIQSVHGVPLKKLECPSRYNQQRPRSRTASSSSSSESSPLPEFNLEEPRNHQSPNSRSNSPLNAFPDVGDDYENDFDTFKPTSSNRQTKDLLSESQFKRLAYIHLTRRCSVLDGTVRVRACCVCLFVCLFVYVRFLGACVMYLQRQYTSYIHH